MPLKVRPFTDSDYPAVLERLNAAQPYYAFTLEEFRGRDERRASQIRHARFVAEEGGEVLGWGQFDQRMDMYHPGKYLLQIAVPEGPEFERVATTLYETLIAALSSLSVVSLRAFAHETRPWEIAFWQGNGYMEDMRDGSATLDLTTFDPAPFAAIEESVAAQGIRLCSITQLATDPERNARLCHLHNTLLADVPPRGERTPMDTETFVRTRLGRLDVLPDGHFVAVAPDSSYIGTSTVNLPSDRNPEVLATGLTGVVPEWRRQGVALALKLRGIRYAREWGAKRLTTFNASDNDPVLALNRRLGFVRDPWRLHLVRTFG